MLTNLKIGLDANMPYMVMDSHMVTGVLDSVHSRAVSKVILKLTNNVFFSGVDLQGSRCSSGDGGQRHLQPRPQDQTFPAASCRQVLVMFLFHLQLQKLFFCDSLKVQSCD